MTRKLVARLMVALALGIATGYAVGKSLANDVARGKALTMKEYVADFETHRQDLIKSGDTPMSITIIIGAVMVALLFGIYELLVFGADRLLAVIDKRRSAGVQPGTPPPW